LLSVAVSGKQTKEIKMINTCKEKIEAQIKRAIARSEAHDQIVRIKIDGDSGDALSAISAVTDCLTGRCMVDREGVDLMDIWGFDDDAKDGDMLWRLNITFTENI
jgi:hypothetical protein